MPTLFPAFAARRWVAAGVCGLLALAIAGPAAARDRLPTSTLNASSLTSAEEGEIEAFVSRWNTQLLEGSDREVAEAREALLQPVRNATSDAFLNQYGEDIGDRLSTALEARRLITRLNAMIVAGELGVRGVRGVIVKGLSDPSPAVNYWAAAGAVKLAQAREQGARISPSAVRDVLESLEGMLEDKRASNPLLYPSLRAAVAMNETEGDELFLETLSRRLELHARRPAIDYRPLLQKGAWTRLIQRSITARTDHGREMLKRSANLAARYFSLVSRQLEEGELGEGPPRSHLDMMLWNQRLLATVNGFLDGPESTPDTREVRNAIENLDTNFLRLSASDWIATLKKRPYLFTPEQLEIPEP